MAVSFRGLCLTEKAKTPDWKLDCTPQAKHELLSFRLWEKDGENYTHFRIHNNGEVVVSKTPDAVLPELGVGIDKVIKEFKSLEFFSTHFAEVRKYLRQHKEDLSLQKILSNKLSSTEIKNAGYFE